VKFIFAILASLLASAAFAVGTTANVAWTAPTAYTDGHVLPSTDIASYTVTWVPSSPYAAAGTASAISTALAVTVSSLTCGSYTFTVTVKTTATAYSPNASATSAPVVYDTGVTCVAPKPGTFTVTVS